MPDPQDFYFLAASGIVGQGLAPAVKSHNKNKERKMNKKVIDSIHKKIKYIWETKIKEDYENGWLLKEDTLKNSLYYHIRTELYSLFEEHNIRIFTEFTDGKFKGSHYRPDMVIATVDLAAENDYYADSIIECLAVIEIKNKAGFNSHKVISADYDKLYKYTEELGVNCKLYMATIWECEDKPTTWIRKNAAWAKGKVTELNASYKWNSDFELQFYVYEH